MRRGSRSSRRVHRIVRVLLPVALVLGGSGIAWAWSTTNVNPGNSVTGGALGATTGLTATEVTAGNSCTTVNLAWTAASGADSYRIEAQVGTSGWTTLAPNNVTTTYADTTVYTNSSIVWRVTPLLSGTSWEGASQTSSQVDCGVGDITDLGITSACGTTQLTWSAPARANRYDIQRQVNGGGWVQIVTNQNSTSYTDTTTFTDGDVVEYQVRPGRNAGTDGNWTSSVTVDPWTGFTIVSVEFGNVGTLGTLDVGDTITVTYSQAVDTGTVTNTDVYTKSNGGAAGKGVYIAATNSRTKRSQVGAVRSAPIFSASAALSGTAAWSAGDTVWTWTSTGTGVDMSSALAGTWATGTSAGAAVCAGDGTTAAAGTPALSGQW